MKLALDYSSLGNEIATDRPAFLGSSEDISSVHLDEAERTARLQPFIGNEPSPQLSDISSAQLEYEERKARLRALIDSMIDSAPSWDAEPATVSVGAASTAIRFLAALPTNRHLPKAAPDGEGDLLFVWEPPYGNCVVTVEQNILHLVDQPGTRNVGHVDAQEFTGVHLPVSILHAIPMR